MDAKKLLLILVLFCLLPVSYGMAGETTIKGTASCVMPDFFELQAQIAVAGQSSVPAAPVPAGASGQYEVQKEEKLIQTEENIVLAQNSKEADQVTVYTVCAR